MTPTHSDPLPQDGHFFSFLFLIGCPNIFVFVMFCVVVHLSCLSMVRMGNKPKLMEMWDTETLTERHTKKKYHQGKQQANEMQWTMQWNVQKGTATKLQDCHHSSLFIFHRRDSGVAVHDWICPCLPLCVARHISPCSLSLRTIGRGRERTLSPSVSYHVVSYFDRKCRGILRHVSVASDAFAAVSHMNILSIFHLSICARCITMHMISIYIYIYMQHHDTHYYETIPTYSLQKASHIQTQVNIARSYRSKIKIDMILKIWN